MMDWESTVQRELKGCFDPDGRLKQLPTKRRKKLLALIWSADCIPSGETWGGRAFSDLLNTLHSFGDPATLRRELFDHWLIDRTPDGGDYRLNPERPTAGALPDKYC